MSVDHTGDYPEYPCYYPFDHPEYPGDYPCHPGNPTDPTYYYPYHLGDYPDHHVDYPDHPGDQPDYQLKLSV